MWTPSFVTLLFLTTSFLIISFVEQSEAKATDVGRGEDCVWTVMPESWRADPSCSKFDTQLAKAGTYITRPIVAYYGSGSTWLLGLIQAATGHYVSRLKNGSFIYVFLDDVANRNRRVPVQLNSGQVSIGKAHYNEWRRKTGGRKVFEEAAKKVDNPYRVILLVRNPWDAILSYRQHLTHKTRTISTQSFLKPGLEHQLLRFATEWLKTANAVISESTEEELLVVQYEKLRANKTEELKRILSFLNLEVNRARLDCLDKHEITGCKRPPFSREASKVVRRSFSKMQKLNSFLEQGLLEINAQLKPRGLHLNYSGLTLPNLKNGTFSD